MVHLAPLQYKPRLVHPCGETSTLERNRKTGKWDKEWSTNNSCFSHLGYEDNSAIKYLADVGRGTTLPMIRFYANFLKTWLTTLPWSVEVVYCRENDESNEYDEPDDDKPVRLKKDKRLCVLWTLKKVTGIEAKDLLYLSAFRYISEEFAGLVPALYKEHRKGKTYSQLFTILQQMHIDAATGGGRWGRRDFLINADGHGLMWPASHYGYSANEPISLALFKKRLADKRVTKSVHSHFNTT
jgi:hypothetical protein